MKNIVGIDRKECSAHVFIVFSYYFCCMYYFIALGTKIIVLKKYIFHDNDLNLDSLLKKLVFECIYKKIPSVTMNQTNE